jgi:hypothetical protein
MLNYQSYKKKKHLQGQLNSGVNFTNILREAFSQEDPKGAKRH